MSISMVINYFLYLNCIKGLANYNGFNHIGMVSRLAFCTSQVMSVCRKCWPVEDVGITQGAVRSPNGKSHA